jgi:hypothetical protein
MWDRLDEERQTTTRQIAIVVSCLLFSANATFTPKILCSSWSGMNKITKEKVVRCRWCIRSRRWPFFVLHSLATACLTDIQWLINQYSLHQFCLLPSTQWHAPHSPSLRTSLSSTSPRSASFPITATLPYRTSTRCGVQQLISTSALGYHGPHRRQSCICWGWEERMLLRQIAPCISSVFPDFSSCSHFSTPALVHASLCASFPSPEILMQHQDLTS